MQIKIKTLTGKVTEHNVENDETVLSLKNSLQEKEVCSEHFFNIYFICRIWISCTFNSSNVHLLKLVTNICCSPLFLQGITVDQIKLIYNGKQLADDKTLESYNIEAGKVLHMVLTLRGGM
jgi:hypothetical protein